MSHEKKKKSLLERYDIPINHLDFDYVKRCQNVKEIEQILKILRTNEEGYFPDLLKTTEDRLRTLNPNSKLLRTEQPLLTKRTMDQSEWKEVCDDVINFEKDIKEKGNLVKKCRDNENINCCDEFIPPVRAISDKRNAIPIQVKVNKDRIASWDYKKWDKYDVDKEIEKIDQLQEQDDAAKKEDSNISEKNETTTATTSFGEMSKNLSLIEKEMMANKHRVIGNDHFKCSEYSEAIIEYTKCIELYPTVVAYNNRAITYLKLKKFSCAINDCDESLKIEPKNIKALIRKGEALFQSGHYRNAYNVFCQILTIDPVNNVAKNRVNEIKNVMPDLPPMNAKRIAIIEDEETSGKKDLKKKPITLAKSSSKQSGNKSPINLSSPDFDFAELIKPNKIVPNKFSRLTNPTKKPDERLPKVKSNEDELKIWTKYEDRNESFIEEIID